MIEDKAQRDGRRAVRERHVDHLAIPYAVDYVAEAADDVLARLAGRAVQIGADLTALEIANNIQRAFDQGVPPVTFNYSTPSQNIQAVRALYQTMTSWDCVRMGSYINSLGLSDAQLTNFFGYSGAALTTFKSKLAAAATKYTDIISQVGG